MRKESKKSIEIILTIHIMIFALVMFIDYKFNSMDNLPQGNYLKSTKSPTEKYFVSFYLVEPIHSTVASSIRAEVLYDGAFLKNKKNIYWNYRESEVSFKWLNNSEIEINGRVIELPDGEYDFRND